MIGIYKITNNLNNKAYIGQSSNIEKRFQYHKNPYNWDREVHKTLYRAFRKYGIENFTFTVLEECSKEELNEREKYWIQYYNTYQEGYNQTLGGEDNVGESHPRHKVTTQDVIDIRTRYKNHERKKEVYLDYNNKIGPSGFDKIWKGETWKHIMPEVYTPENKTFQLHNTGNSGSSNGRAKLKETDVYNIRYRKKQGEKIKEVYEDYKDLLTLGSFACVWYNQNWRSVVV